MKLKDLLQNIVIENIVGDLDTEISSICFDSSKAQEGCLFVCLKGKRCDGIAYADIAIAKGAKAVICACNYTCRSTTVVKVANTRRALSELAINFYNNPAQRLKIIGVVGTNGKSTTAYIIAQLLRKGGKNVGLIGTMYYEYNDKKLNSDMTTPDPVELQKLLCDMADEGVEYVVMEVSAHAIHLEKLWGVITEITVFTNLSQDHLDYFGNMDDYKKCKMSYFCPQLTKMAVVNIDDDCGREIYNTAQLPMISYGLKNPSEVFAIDIEYYRNGCNYTCNAMDDIMPIESNLLGEFNIYNSLASIAVARLLDITCDSIMSCFSSIQAPEGRFNSFVRNGVNYIVDFAHTPDGLYNLLKEARKLCQNKVITIFGCGGDRDIAKRPIMGKIASEMSDIVIVTTDNPRTESRKSIAGDILSGVRLKGKLYVELDRGKAIALGAELAKSGDIVLIAGKGSENYIDENNTKIPYSDFDEIKKILERAI